MEDTLFKKLGGFSVVRKIVSRFYDGVLDSPVLQGYFVNTNMEKLIDHQTRFISSLLGGPGSVSDAQLRKSHARLNIQEDAWVELLSILEETLEEFELADGDISYLLKKVSGKKPLIVKPQHPEESET